LNTHRLSEFSTRHPASDAALLWCIADAGSLAPSGSK
jgi:hypothetical protein